MLSMFVYRAPHSDKVTIHFVLNMQTTVQRFTQIKFIFLNKLLNNMIDCPKLLLNKNDKKNPKNYRHLILFYIEHCTKNYL